MFEDFNRTHGITEGTDILTPDLIQEKKFVIKPKKKKSKDADVATDFDFGGEEETDTEESTDDFDFGGEEGDTGSEEESTDEFDFGGEEGDAGSEEETDTEEGGDEFDFGGEEETDTEEDTTEITDDETDEDLDLEDDSEDNIKDIQKLTGKLGQKIRDTEDLSSDTMKWVAKSVISALDLDIMDSEDKKDIIRAVKKKSKEDSDAEFDFMGEDPEDENDDWHPDQSFMDDEDNIVDWNTLSDEEKTELLRSHNSDSSNIELGGDVMEDEEELYGPGDEDVEGGEMILDDFLMDDDTEDITSNPPLNRTDYMSNFSKNVKRSVKTFGKKIDDPELGRYLNKLQNKLGGTDKVSIDDNRVVGDFGYVEVTPTGYVLHKEGSKFGERFGFDELGLLQKEVSNVDYMSYMDDPYMMPQEAPVKPTTKPDVKPGTDKPSPSKRPFSPPPFIRPGEEPAPKAEYDYEDEDFYGVNYDNDDTLDYMDDYMMTEYHLNTKMVSIEQEMAYEDVEDMARENGLEVVWDKKDRSSDPEEETVYLSLKRGNKIVGTVRINPTGDVEMGGPMKKSFKGQPVDNEMDFDEYLGEKNIQMNPKTAPTKPTTKPDVKPGKDNPSPSKRPFSPPPFIRPGEEPAPKARRD